MQNLRILSDVHAGSNSLFVPGDIIPAKAVDDPARLVTLGAAAWSDEDCTKQPPAALSAVMEMDDDELGEENKTLRTRIEVLESENVKLAEAKAKAEEALKAKAETDFEAAQVKEENKALRTRMESAESELKAAQSLLAEKADAPKAPTGKKAGG